ncbi:MULTISPECIES: DUF1488 domain-containing protein [unclassified Beijerinckia]|uniref:DUF1488 domain-containing protein n=1 Tax=unclassified Beijerinckia TaxID=2638183 RepID=UPI00089AF477|nr:MULTISPECIES: DUF1488 domain-containing protein [unclassified Beijerinckia]MDH7797558.1 hypothetical protein [Beijerinckia sp. GAS462]SEC90406.1 Protein of unknown function [Beijerinckia sp. 28-YEA-48]
MTLTFPNPSRSFDQARNAIRFTAHDGLFEVPFYVAIDALAKSGNRASSEAECLKAFDAARSSVQDAARAAYTNGHRGFYMLKAVNFR